MSSHLVAAIIGANKKESPYFVSSCYTPICLASINQDQSTHYNILRYYAGAHQILSLNVPRSTRQHIRRLLKGSRKKWINNRMLVNQISYSIGRGVKRREILRLLKPFLANGFKYDGIFTHLVAILLVAIAMCLGPILRRIWHKTELLKVKLGIQRFKNQEKA